MISRLIQRLRNTPPAELVLWGSILFIVILLATTGGFLFRNPAPVSTPASETALGQSGSPTPPPVATPLPEVALPPSRTPQPTLAPLWLPTVTPPPGGQVYAITPVPEAVGWVRQGDETPNHFGDYNIYAGAFEGRTYLGAVQFDLSGVPPGAPIVYADLTLVGLSDEWLGSRGTLRQAQGRLWHVELLESWVEEDWPQKDFDALQRPDGAALELTPPLTAGDLGTGRVNTWVFGPDALEALRARTYRGRVSFRIRGPNGGADNLSKGSGQSLFTWDSGYGTGSRGRGPLLRLVTGRAPETPPPSPTPHYVIITPVPRTPTPRNVVTLAARLMTATAEATPYEGTGTPTPSPTPTPLPPDWVTPVIIVPTATPANAATAEWHALVATAAAFVYGTPTPWPPNAWTATPLPPPALLIDLADLTPTPTPTATPRVTPTPAAIPHVLRGRIALRSSRVPGDRWILVMNPDGSDVKLLADPWAYGFVRQRELRSPDGTQMLVVETKAGRILPYIVRLSLLDDTRLPLTPDQRSYDPAWSPTGEWIAYVGEAPDGNEELYLMRPDGSGRTRLTFTPDAWEKQPTWSPDGRRIAFVSDRETGHAQIWIINADGSGARNLSDNEYNETDPVWLK